MTQFKLNERIKKLIDEETLTTAKVQRRLEVGYSFAADLIDYLAHEGLLLEFDRKVKIIKKGKEEEVYNIILNFCNDNQVFEKNTNTDSGNASVAVVGSDISENDIYKKLLPKVVKNGWVSAAYIQNLFKVGYSRAARIVDRLLDADVVERVDKKIVCKIKEEEIEEAFENIMRLYR